MTDDDALRPQWCPKCLGHGQTCMDHCYRCGGTGSVFVVDDAVYPNTEPGLAWAVSALQKKQRGPLNDQR